MPWKDPEKRAEAQRRRRAADPEAYKAYKHEMWEREKARYAADPELYQQKLAKQKQWIVENREHHKSVVRKNHYQRNFGLTPEQVSQFFAAQDGKCGCCGVDKSGGQGWAIDHNHVTGHIRGILCYKCNVGGGMFNDDPELLRKAVEWFSKS